MYIPLTFILFGEMEVVVAYALLLSTLTVLTSCHQVCFIGSEYDPRYGKPPRWFLPYKDPCKCTAIRLGGMNIPASSYLQGAPYYLDKLLLSEDPEEIQATFGCPTASSAVECLGMEHLGLEDGTIPDARMTASSARSARPVADGRLSNPNGHWSLNSPEGSWIEVDLVDRTVVTGVITQGSSSISQNRVTQYNVAYKESTSSGYEYVTDDKGDIEVFVGNVDDADTPVTNMFHQSIIATAVRIEPVAWIGGVSFRFELLGCRIH